MHSYDSHAPHCKHSVRRLNKVAGVQLRLRGCTTDILICGLAALLSDTITLKYPLNYFEQNKWHLPLQEISKGGMCEIDKQTKRELEAAVELVWGRINSHVCLFSENNQRHSSPMNNFIQKEGTSGNESCRESMKREITRNKEDRL